MDNKFSFRRVFLVATLAVLVLIVFILLAGRFLVEESPASAVAEVTPEVEVVVAEPTPLISESGLIKVLSPQVNATVTNPIIITGEAKGYWFFEGSFPITVVDWNGLIIGEGYATALTEWMTEDFVAFRGEVNFSLPLETPYKRGAVILRKDNPSDLPELDDSLEIPILFN